MINRELTWLTLARDLPPWRSSLDTPFPRCINRRGAPFRSVTYAVAREGTSFAPALRQSLCAVLSTSG
jgi:hypothetical protein